MRRDVARSHLLDLTAQTAFDQREIVEEALRNWTAESVSVAAADRDELLRAYSIRRFSLVRNDIDPSGLDALLDRLERYPHKQVWSFAIDTDERSILGFLDDELGEMVGLLVLPRNFKALARKR
jgi:hypothetical protein